MKELNEKDTLIRMAASLLVSYASVQHLPEDERLAEEEEISVHDDELTDSIAKYAIRNKLDIDETIESITAQAEYFIESGNYDREVAEMLIEDGEDLTEYFEPKQLH